MSNLSSAIDAGPLTSLLRDSDVLEIMVDGPHSVYMERRGKLEDAPVAFRDEAHLMDVIRGILASQGRQIEESKPIVDIWLPDDTRIHIVMPAIAVNGPFMVIRKLPQNMFSAEDLIRFGSWTEEIKTFLQACVSSRLNIAIAGGTGSGKTTIFNIVANMIDDEERILIVQNFAGLRLNKKRVVRQEIR